MACSPRAPLVVRMRSTWAWRSASVYGACGQNSCSRPWLARAPPANEVSSPRPMWRKRSMSQSRSWPAAYPAPYSVPYRVVPLMCGTPVALSRVMVTSGRGEVVDWAWPLGTPNEASLKKVLSLSSVSEDWPATRASYLPSSSSLCAGWVPNILLPEDLHERGAAVGAGRQDVGALALTEVAVRGLGGAGGQRRAEQGGTQGGHGQGAGGGPAPFHAGRHGPESLVLRGSSEPCGASSHARS